MKLEKYIKLKGNIMTGWAICHKYEDEKGNIQIKIQPEIGRYKIYKTRKQAKNACLGKLMQEKIVRVEIY